MKALVSIAAFACGLASLIARAHGADGGELYKQFMEAINRGDIPAATELIAEDVKWTRGPACLRTCVGKARITEEIRRQIADHNATSKFTSTMKDENTFVVRFEHRSDATTKRGFERRIQLDTVTLKDGKIAVIVSDIDVSDPETARFAATPAR